jgi:hypothetical protein
MFGSFKRKPPLPPLTEACIKLADFENLMNFADIQTRNNLTSIDNRAIALFLIIMGAAGHFVSGLKNPQDNLWKEVWRYLRETNLDVITAETMVWVMFLMAQLWRAEQKRDRETFKRISYGTYTSATRLALDMIEAQTGFDFKAGWTERMKFYKEELGKARSGAISDAFASIVLQSAGRRSLAEPLKTIAPLQAPPEWLPLAAKVMIFFSTMPSGFYESYKNVLRGWPDRFPEDDDDSDD